MEVDDGARLWVDGLAIIDEWHDGQAIYTGEATLDEGKHAVQLEMYEHTGDALVRFRWELTDTEPLWRAKYYGNPSLQGPPVLARNDAQIDFNWGMVHQPRGCRTTASVCDGYFGNTSRQVPTGSAPAQTMA